jgi:hypothetical protein
MQQATNWLLALLFLMVYLAHQSAGGWGVRTSRPCCAPNHRRSPPLRP